MLHSSADRTARVREHGELNNWLYKEMRCGYPTGLASASSWTRRSWSTSRGGERP
ncbi:MAG: hypothetical protein ACRDSE_18070 [Pseudonocardiaceae bacterium]